MKLFQRLFFAALVSGLLAGLVLAAIQNFSVVPLVHQAEAVEVATTETDAHLPGTPTHPHDPDAWSPQDGIERTFYTVLSTVLVSIGFALLLAAVAVIAGLDLTARNGILWGAAGFATFQLAPAFGLPPELPGMADAELALRQFWWWGTALATGTAALLVARFRSWPAIAIAAVLVLSPHIVGAPATPDVPTAVPAHLASAFAARTLGTGAVFWTIVGPLLGWLTERFAQLSATASKRAPA